jgi:hypothetical protein
VRIRGQRNLHLDLRSALFRASGVVGDIDPDAKVAWRQHVAIINSSNIVISGLRVRGAWNCTYSELYEGESAFFVYESRNVTLSRVTARAIAGDGVEIAGATGLTVSGSTFDCTGRMGVSVIRTSADILVRESSFDRIGRSVFDVELTNDNATATDIRFKRNRIAAHGLLVLAGGGRGTKSGISLVANRSTAKPIRIKVVGDDFAIRDNRGTGVATSPMVAASSGTDLVVEGNIQHMSPPVAPISLTEWCDASATDNDFGSPAVLFEGIRPEGCRWLDGGGNG